MKIMCLFYVINKEHEQITTTTTIICLLLNVGRMQMVIQQLEPLAEQQIMGIYGLRHSSQQAEDALSQGLDQLQHSLVDTIAGGLVVDGVQQMVLAFTKLSNLEGFVRQVISKFTPKRGHKYWSYWFSMSAVR